VSEENTQLLSCFLLLMCLPRYFRDSTPSMVNLKQYRMWAALEAGSGIVSQHDYDGRNWWDVENDPFDDSDSPLWAFTKYRALNRLALRTKLDVRYMAHPYCSCNLCSCNLIHTAHVSLIRCLVSSTSPPQWKQGCFGLPEARLDGPPRRCCHHDLQPW
jgi:hypothetical protein